MPSVSRSNWEGHTLDKTWIQENYLKKASVSVSTVPQLLKFRQFEKLYTLGKNLLFQNLPGSRYQLMLSTFLFINLLQDLIDSR